jgi:hypothetical protein
MKVLIYTLLFYFIIIIEIYSQKIDTLIIPNNLYPINSEIKIEYDSLKINLINNNYSFDGYLIIQLDSNTIINRYEFSIKTPIFWKNSIDSINDTTDKIYFWLPDPDLISEYCIEYENGIRDDITIFFKYYFLYNESNSSSCRSFLYKYNYNSLLLSSSLFQNENIFTLKKNTKIHFVIIKCSFNTSIFEIENIIIIKHKYSGKKFVKAYVPVSNLIEFKIIKEIDNDNLIKGGLIIKNIE